MIATGWQTVDFIKNLSSPQKKFYFIQDYEPWFADANVDLAKSTYLNSFSANIVYAEWMQQKLLEEHHLDTTFVKCGTTSYESKTPTAIGTHPKRILLYFKLKNHYGRGADLIEQLLKKLVNHPDLKLNVIGHEDPRMAGRGPTRWRAARATII